MWNLTVLVRSGQTVHWRRFVDGRSHSKRSLFLLSCIPSCRWDWPLPWTLYANSAWKDDVPIDEWRWLADRNVFELEQLVDLSYSSCSRQSSPGYARKLPASEFKRWCWNTIPSSQFKRKQTPPFPQKTKAKSKLTILQSAAYDVFSSETTVFFLFQSSSLNVWHQPCVDDVNYTVENCQLECFSEKAVQTMGCLLPFMKLSSSSPLLGSFGPCTTPDSYRKADEKLTQFISNISGTHLPWVEIFSFITTTSYLVWCCRWKEANIDLHLSSGWHDDDVGCNRLQLHASVLHHRVQD